MLQFTVTVQSRLRTSVHAYLQFAGSRMGILHVPPHKTLRPGRHYPHVTWAHVMLLVQFGCERRFNIEFYGADSHFCHCLRHVISRGALVGSRASTPLKFLLSHTFRETWRTSRALFRRWIVLRRFTLLSLCLRHVISRGALVGSRASTPLKFLLSHTFRETWRTCRALFRRYHLYPEIEEMLIKKSAQTDLFIWHQVTRL